MCSWRVVCAAFVNCHSAGIACSHMHVAIHCFARSLVHYAPTSLQTKDDMVYVASEVGVLGDVLTNAENIVAKGRLGPGQMVCADLTEGACTAAGWGLGGLCVGAVWGLGYRKCAEESLRVQRWVQSAEMEWECTLFGCYL